MIQSSKFCAIEGVPDGMQMYQNSICHCWQVKSFWRKETQTSMLKSHIYKEHLISRYSSEYLRNTVTVGKRPREIRELIRLPFSMAVVEAHPLASPWPEFFAWCMETKKKYQIHEKLVSSIAWYLNIYKNYIEDSI
ncbi:hypothetical protein KFK09_015501 [Dendrobium nobile]|uniref:Uncharacterized protein n=1 Tax=Dendrobium nobile TaxID=94219 RepID=A0A8T3B6Z7_DENNO|nr:hypothetical protein KFK09_015501 [Dendrobium nobile]